MWKETSEGLYREFVFADFSAAFGFMARVALLAEQHAHHPKWVNVYNTVTIWLNTHDQNGAITSKDRALAKAIDLVTT